MIIFLAKTFLSKTFYKFEGRLCALTSPHQLLIVNTDSGVSLPRVEHQLSQLSCNLVQNIEPLYMQFPYSGEWRY